MRGKKPKSFQSGDFVFAKLKGFRPWPAKVMLTEGKYKYCVFFYGTEEYSKRLKPANLFDYHKFKDRYGKRDANTKTRFIEALEEVEAALKGKDIAPATANFDLDKELAKSDKCEPVPVEKYDAEVEEEEETEETNENSVVEDQPHQPIRIKPEKKQASSSVIVVQQLKNQDENSNQITKRGRGKRALENNNDSPAPKRTRMPAKSKQNNKKQENLVDPAKTKLLEVEISLFNLHLEIIKYLAPHHKPNTKDCIKALEEMKKFSENFTQIMLKKNANWVETVKRLKFYVPDTQKHRMKEAEKLQSLEAAKRIRELAEEIYEKVKDVFEYQERDEMFWKVFMDKVDAFREKTDPYGVEFVEELCFEEELA